MIAIFYALEAEIKELRKAAGFTSLSSPGSRTIQANYKGKGLLLAATGVGKDRAREVAERTLRTYPVSVVISTGFAGALNRKTKAGDVVIGLHMQAEQSKPGESLIAAASLTAAAQRIENSDGFRWLTGRGVTTDQVCATPEAKRRLCAEFQADFVDMESYWIGLCAAAKRLPFITIRTVSDSVEDDLSFLGKITAGGRISPAGTVRHFITHPGDMPRTIGLAGQMAKASQNLAWFLEHFIGEITSEDESNRSG